MKKNIKYIIVFIIFVSIILIIIKNKAYANTTIPTVSASGGYTILLGVNGILEENVINKEKHVSFAMNIDSEPCYLRIKAFAPSSIKLLYSDATGRWKKGENDDYYYYSSILNPGEVTEDLLIAIENMPEDEIIDEFNIAVISETTEVRYNPDGTPYYNWEYVSNK